MIDQSVSEQTLDAYESFLAKRISHRFDAQAFALMGLDLGGIFVLPDNAALIMQPGAAWVALGNGPGIIVKQYYRPRGGISLGEPQQLADVVSGRFMAEDILSFVKRCEILMRLDPLYDFLKIMRELYLEAGYVLRLSQIATNS
jgi:hypothetical protein